jgi:hypothetical protein
MATEAEPDDVVIAEPVDMALREPIDEPLRGPTHVPLRAITKLPINDLVANPRNARKHPAAQVAMMAKSLLKFGQTRPILARAQNRMIIVGHGLWTAAKDAGLTDIDVILWDVDQATADQYMVADNRLGDLSKDDPDLLGALLREAPEADLFSMGFMATDLDAAFGQMETILIHEVEATPVHDRFWISVKGRLRDQARALDRLRQFLADMPEVEVELGTVTLD